IAEMFPDPGSPASGTRSPHRSSDASAGDLTAAPTGAANNKPLGFTLKDVNPAHPMIQERGISVETARLFGVGFFPGKGSMSGRVVFPLYESGNLVGYAGRTTLPATDTNPKWLLGKGLRKTFLYALERCDPAKPVIVCESLWA